MRLLKKVNLGIFKSLTKERCIAVYFFLFFGGSWFLSRGAYKPLFTFWRACPASLVRWRFWVVFLICHPDLTLPKCYPKCVLVHHRRGISDHVKKTSFYLSFFFHDLFYHLFPQTKDSPTLFFPKFSLSSVRLVLLNYLNSTSTAPERDARVRDAEGRGRKGKCILFEWIPGSSPLGDKTWRTSLLSLWLHLAAIQSLL